MARYGPRVREKKVDVMLVMSVVVLDMLCSFAAAVIAFECNCHCADLSAITEALVSHSMRPLVMIMQ